MAFHSQIDSHILKEGYLWKAGRLNPAFKRRYFVLYDDRTVKYYSKQSRSKSRSNAKGTIYLTQIKRIEFVQYIHPDTHSLKPDHISSSKSAPLLPQSSSSIAESDTLSLKSHAVNGYNICNYNNNIVSSSAPPPKYCIDKREKQKQIHKLHIKNRTKSLVNDLDKSLLLRPQQKRTRTDTQPVPIRLSLSCTKSISNTDIDEDDVSINQSLLPMRNSYNEDIVLSMSIRNEYMDEMDTMIDQHKEIKMFVDIMNNTKLRLKCCRRYSFALIQNNREWILSADNEYILKEWMFILNKLCQSTPMFSGYLSLKNNKKYDINYDKKFCILFENKLLNCYKDDVCDECLFDIDLRTLIWIKYDECLSHSLEIATFNGSYIVSADTDCLRHKWHHEICSLFADKFILNLFYDSAVCSITMDHNEQHWKNRYIALFQGYLVIFKNKKQLNSIKNMTFFSDRIFGDYTRNHCCSVIPLDNNAKVSIMSNENCKYAFCVVYEDRRWCFYVATAYILSQWISFLFHQDTDKSLYEYKAHSRSVSINKLDFTPSNAIFDRSISFDAYS